ncbi:MAG: hypothetical protein K8T25_04940 [Planctomycetia bacterium]|nr:hypothetical protein [Planctomycetia bacterium]
MSTSKVTSTDSGVRSGSKVRPGSSVQRPGSAGAGSTPGPNPVVLTLWPLVSRRALAEPVPWLALALGLIAWFVTQNEILTGLAVAAVVLSAWRYFVPVRFQIDAAGIHQRVLSRRRVVHWTAVRRVELRDTGVLLRFDAGRQPLDVFNSLYVPYGGKRAEVLAWFESLEARG